MLNLKKNPDLKEFTSCQHTEYWDRLSVSDILHRGGLNKVKNKGLQSSTVRGSQKHAMFN